MSQTETFQALVTSEHDGQFQTRLQTRHFDALAAGHVRIQVHYSSLNYKDALSSQGNRGVTKNYPHTPGIDAAGVVSLSHAEQWAVGDPVIVTSYDLGMNTAGGLAEFIDVPADWVVALPDGLSLKSAMILGTSGLTAGLAFDKLQRCGLSPDQGPVIVTGASGGVGSLSVALLAQQGYEVWAVSGKPALYDWLKQLGASDCLGRDAVQAPPEKPLLRPRWAGAIDTVGGNILSSVVRACHKEGVVAVCGLVQSPELNLTVFPFILNGIHLVGVDSAQVKMAQRQKIWQRWATDWTVPDLGEHLETIPLAQVPEALAQMLAGQSRGKKLVQIGSDEV